MTRIYTCNTRMNVPFYVRLAKVELRSSRRLMLVDPQLV
jgi:hypothetical protein